MQSERRTVGQRTAHGLWVALGAMLCTAALFLVLPVVQAINRPPESDLELRSADTVAMPPPPPPLEEEEPEEEPEPEEPPPELEDDAPRLDLAQLELSLDGGAGDGWAADFQADLDVAGGPGGNLDGLFSSNEFDDAPRPISRAMPVIDSEMRERMPGKVVVKLIVDEDGRVENAIVESATDPVFVEPTLAAVEKWKFEPAQRDGVPVRAPLRQPILF